MPKLLKERLYFEIPDDEAGELVLKGGRCRCGHSYFPMQTYGCERCGRHGDDLTPTDLSSRGTLLAQALVRIHADKNRPTPFMVVKVALDDGPVVRSLLSESETPIAPGQRMFAKLAEVPWGDAGETALDLRFAADRRTQD